MGRFNYFRLFELLLATATHRAKLTTCSKATALNWRFGVTLYMFRMCSSQTPPLRSSLTSTQKQRLHSENLLSTTAQRMDTLSLSTTYLFRASDMFKKKAITSDGFRCHILTIHQELDDAASARRTENSESSSGVFTVYDLIIIGAGPGGIALAAEACASGIKQSQILECLAPFGRYVIFGSTRGPSAAFEPRRLIQKSKMMTGIYLPVFLGKPDLIRAGLAFLV